MNDGEEGQSKRTREVMDTFRSDTTNDATGGTVKKDSNENSRENLKDAEKQAANGTAPQGDYAGGEGASSAAKANAAEDGVPSDAFNFNDSFRTHLKGRGLDIGDDGKIKGKGFLKGLGKKRGPMFTVAILLMFLCGFTGASYLGLAALPLSLISQFQGMFDVKGPTNLMRMNRATKWMMHPNTRKISSEADLFVRQHSKIYQMATGSGENYFHITNYQQRKLAKKGISVEKIDGVGQVMVFNKTVSDENGVTSTQRIEVVADEAYVTGDNRRLIGEILDNDVDFANQYHEGTATWRKGVKDWFNQRAEGFMQKMSIIRDRFHDFIAGIFNRNKEGLEETVSDAVGDVEMTSKSSNDAIEMDEVQARDSNGNLLYNEDGSPKMVPGSEKVVDTDVPTNDVSLKKGDSLNTVKSKLKNFTNGMASKVAGIASKAVNFICAGAEIFTAINLMVIAYEGAQILKVASTMFEGIQKTQDPRIGSKNSPINDIGITLTKPKTTYYYDDAGNGSEEVVESSATGAAMEAEYIASIYEDREANPEDISIRSFNLSQNTQRGFDWFTRQLGAITTAVGGSIMAYKSCTYAKIAAAAADAILDFAKYAMEAVDVISCILGAVASAGVSCAGLIKDLALEIGKAIASAAFVMIIAGAVTSFLAGKVFSMLARDLTKDIGGLDYGNALGAGASLYMGKENQYGGSSPATEETYRASLIMRDEYLAEEAKYQRSTRSPFDASSPYTFMGALTKKMMPIISNTGSALKDVGSLASIVGNSISSMMPGASAISAATLAKAAKKNTDKYCPELGAIGVLGDVTCNPLYATDASTMDMDFAEVAYQVSIQNNGKNFILDESDENTVINTDIKESKLMKYIAYCPGRLSPLGYPDSNIANAIKDNNLLVDIAPVAGSVNDIKNEKKVLKNIGFVTGATCVPKSSVRADASSSTLASSSDNVGDELLGDVDDPEGDISWKEARLYQRYIEDQNLAENMGLIEKSSVTAALEKYYAEHPIDESFEGLLALYTGMTKERVTDTLAIIEGLIWIADYDPSDMYPYLVEDEEETQISIEDTDYIETEPMFMDGRYPEFLLSRKEYYIS